MRREILITMFILVFVFKAVGQNSLNMEYFGNRNDRATPSGFYGSYSACWGYTAADGREYALLGTYGGTSIVDITDSTALREVAFIPGPPSSWREMKTYRSYAYVVTENGTTPDSGIQIIDLSNLPISAMKVKNYVWVDTINGIPTPIPKAHTISTSGNYLYLNGGGSYTGIRIVDVTDPVNPKKAGKYVGPYIHDSFIRSDTIFASAIYSGGGLDIIDARNKANPTRIKLLQYTGSGTHNAWVTIGRRYAVTTDEIGTTTRTLKVWDILDIQNPTKVAEVSNSINIVHNVFIKGNLAYTAWYAGGIRVIDLSNPANPVEVGYYRTFPKDSTNYVGDWGADPFFPSGKVIASDMQTGLYVVRYTGDKRGKIVGTIKNASNGALIQDALLHFKEPSITRWTGSNGRYLFGYAPGTYNVLVERAGYVSKTIQVTVHENMTDTVEIVLNPIVTLVEGTQTVQPRDFVLQQNYPNPFNPTTNITLALPKEIEVKLSVFNIFGQEIRTLAQGKFSQGLHQVQFDASGLSSGVYFYTLKTPEFISTRKMTVVK